METVWEPLILAASAAPNPAVSGQTVKITVQVVDVFGKEQTVLWGADEIGSGEG